MPRHSPTIQTTRNMVPRYDTATMPRTNHDRIHKALLQLRDSLREYVARSLGTDAHSILVSHLPPDWRGFDDPLNEWDVRMLLKAIKFSRAEHGWIEVPQHQIDGLLNDANSFSHQRPFDDCATTMLCGLIWKVMRQVSPGPGPKVRNLFKTYLKDARDLVCGQPVHTWHWPEDWKESWHSDRDGGAYCVGCEDRPDGRPEGVNICVVSHRNPYRRDRDCPALALAQRMLEPAKYKNSLVFLAMAEDEAKILDEAIAQRLAWETVCSAIQNDKDLMQHEVDGARACFEQACRVLDDARRKGCRWLLIPIQDGAERPVEWRHIELPPSQDPVWKARQELEKAGCVLTRLKPQTLAEAREKQRGGEPVKILELAEEFALSVYRPRLQNQDVLGTAIHEGVEARLFEYWISESPPKDPIKFAGFRQNLIGFLAKPGHGLVAAR